MDGRKDERTNEGRNGQKGVYMSQRKKLINEIDALILEYLTDFILVSRYVLSNFLSPFLHFLGK